jgi:hypothetical protein
VRVGEKEDISIEDRPEVGQLLLLCDTILTGTFASDALDALGVASCLYWSVDLAFAATKTLRGEAAIVAIEWPPYPELERARRSRCVPIAVVCDTLTDTDVRELTSRGAAVVVTLARLGDARDAFAQVIEYLETWRPVLAAERAPFEAPQVA